jgi:hypothetical protein
MYFDNLKKIEDVMLDFIMRINQKSNCKELAIESQNLITDNNGDKEFLFFSLYSDVLKNNNIDFYTDILSSMYVMYTTYEKENKLNLLSDEFKSMFENSDKIIGQVDDFNIKFYISMFIHTKVQLINFSKKYPKIYDELQKFQN